MEKAVVEEKKYKYLSYYISTQQFGIDIDQVQEVLKLQKPAQLPKLPDFVEGIIKYQDKVIPLVDLRKRFGMKTIVDSEFTRVMVVKIKNELVGMIADNIHRIVNISTEQLKKPPKMFKGLEKKYIVGVTAINDESIVILDLAKILEDEEVIKLFGTQEPKRSRDTSKSKRKSTKKKKK